MKLELIRLDRQKPPIVLQQFPVIVGLDRGADICLDDSSIGHYQCMIDESDGLLTVWDLGTKLGTFINDVRISPTATLMPGDELTIGKNRFLARYDGPAKPPRRTEDDERPGSRPPAPPHRRRQPVAQA
jgi:pSer/pThr/pTyr-binding forkhead associated (FHA) protein